MLLSPRSLASRYGQRDYRGGVCHPDHRGDVPLTQEWRIRHDGELCRQGKAPIIANYSAESAIFI
jgi:hypothetical protein